MMSGLDLASLIEASTEKAAGEAHDELTSEVAALASGTVPLNQDRHREKKPASEVQQRVLPPKVRLGVLITTDQRDRLREERLQTSMPASKVLARAMAARAGDIDPQEDFIYSGREMTVMTLTVPRGLYERFQGHKALTGESVSALARRAIRDEYGCP